MTTTTAPSNTSASSGSKTSSTVGGDVTALEVDRTSRFSKLDTFCEPTTDKPAETPKATDKGITANAISITHIRVTLEDLQDLGFAIPIGDPADQVKRFVGLINDRCGGINGRKLDLSLVEAPPLAPVGEDPNAIAQAACISATEDHKAVIAFSGTGWGGQGGASCVTDAHDTIYLTTYNITQDEIKKAGNRLYSLALSSADGLEYLARTLNDQGAFDGKTVGIVMQDSPGDPDIVQDGLIDTLQDLGVNVKRVDTLGCGGGNSCTTGVIESVQGMIADGVDVLFPLLNVINLPGYLGEMVTQGVKPGQIQMYQSGYNAAERRSRVEQGHHVRGRGRGQALQRHEDHRRRSDGRVPRAGLHTEPVRRDVQPRVPGRRRPEVQRVGPEDELALRRHGRQLHLRPADRARGREGGTEPDAQVAGGCDGEPRRDRHGRRVPRQLRQGQVHRAQRAQRDDVPLPVRGRHAALRRHVHHSGRQGLPDPVW